MLIGPSIPNTVLFTSNESWTWAHRKGGLQDSAVLSYILNISMGKCSYFNVLFVTRWIRLYLYKEQVFVLLRSVPCSPSLKSAPQRGSTLVIWFYVNHVGSFSYPERPFNTCSRASIHSSRGLGKLLHRVVLLSCNFNDREIDQQQQ